MKKPDFSETLKEMIAASPRLPLGPESRIMIVSDLHAGDGGTDDDFRRNESLFLDALDGLYLKDGWTLVLNGDIEELQKFRRRDVMRAHAALYDRFRRFEAEGRLFKILGNHDLSLIRAEDRPFELHHALVLERGKDILACFHGHQASKFFMRHNYVSGFILRYLARPLRIKNVDRPFKSQLKAERRIYRASKALGIASVTGHTHLPLFESLDKKEWLKFSLERLLSAHARSAGDERERLERKIVAHAGELKRLAKRRARKRRSIRSFYENDGLPVPCLFNSGCVTAKGGFTCIEIEGEDISLVEWSRPGTVREWVEREALERFVLPSLLAARYTLRREPLDIVFNKIRLLGGASAEGEEGRAGDEETPDKRNPHPADTRP